MNARKIFFATLLTAFTLSTQAQDQSKQLLDQVSTEMASYKTMDLVFEYSLDNNQEDVHQQTSGTAQIQGDLYHINFLDNVFIYDGENTIVIIPEDEEVNISQGNMDDEGLMTPSKLFSFYKEGYTYKWDILVNEEGKKIQFIQLIPIDTNSEVGSMLLGIDVDQKRIYKLIETGKDGVITTFKISKFGVNSPISEDLFKFDKNHYEELDYIINQS